MESSFTDAEKRFVLAEMIKVSHIDVDTLVDFVKRHEIYPQWLLMQLPSGRNMMQCLQAAEVMFDMRMSPPPMPVLKRKSLGDISEHLSKRQALMSPLEPQPYSAPRSFNFQSAHATQPVNIQPRPASNPNGYPLASPSAPSPTVSASNPQPPSGRKRGRPSRAQREAWARANPSPSSSGYTPITPVPIAPLPSPSAPSSHAYNATSHHSVSQAPAPPDSPRDQPTSFESRDSAARHEQQEHQLESPAVAGRASHNLVDKQETVGQRTGGEHSEWRDLVQTVESQTQPSKPRSLK
ncbi:hypothetical protein VTK73DRAFT_7467 [Phialemonium thermophilum]|uniref:Uncharacterized protein n=1 Tax=Phialemonium thermophilum TaxID=223376 RepID=A0ABR3XS52_9PEZI